MIKSTSRSTRSHRFTRSPFILDFLESRLLLSGSITPNDPAISNQWYLTAIGMPAAWGIAKGNEGSPNVYVLTTRLDKTNLTDLNTVINDGSYINISTSTATISSMTTQSPWQAGTSAVSVIAEDANNSIGGAGIGWQLAVRSDEVLGMHLISTGGQNADYQLTISDDAALAATNGAIAAKNAGVYVAAVEAAFADAYDFWNLTNSNALTSAMQAAANAGILWVGDLRPDLAGTVSPDVAANVVNVGGYDQYGNRYSDYLTGSGDHDIYAPAGNIYTQVPGVTGGYASYSNMNYAYSIVTGVLGLEAAAHFKFTGQRATSAQLKQWLLDSADLVTLNGESTPVRCINAAAAVLAAAGSGPAVATNLAFTSIGSNSIGLSWLDNADTETGYNVESSTDGITWTTAATLGANVTSATISGLTANTTYQFRVKTNYSGTLSAPSNVAIGDTRDHLPVGAFYTTAFNRITGWAFDQDIGASSINVNVLVDGVNRGTFAANINRPDLAGYSYNGLTIVGLNHGFSIDLSTLNISTGAHTIVVNAVNDHGSSTAQVGSMALTDYAAMGASNIVTDRAQGWVYDQNSATNSTYLDLKIDGIDRGTFLANVYRSDVNGAIVNGVTIQGAYHGYAIDLSAYNLGYGTHTVEVLAIDDLNPNTLTSLGVKTYTNFAPIGVFGSFGSTGKTVTGWAYDPDMGINADYVQIIIDGSLVATVAANIYRSDLDGVIYGGYTIQGGYHGFAYDLTPLNLAAGSHTVTVKAIDTESGQLVLLGTKTLTI